MTNLQAEFEILDDAELQPQDEVLFNDLSLARKELMGQGRAIKSVRDYRIACSKITLNFESRWSSIWTLVLVAYTKKKILRKLLSRKRWWSFVRWSRSKVCDITPAYYGLRLKLGLTAELMDKLDSDLAQLRKCFNERILYFRQLQEISDSVAEVTWLDSTLAGALQACRTEQTELEAKINTSRARQRYLDHLAKNDGMNEEDETCILCRCDFTRGFITQCAHVFCEGCMKAWLARHNRTCPVCRTAIIIDQIQRFTVHDNASLPTTKPIDNKSLPRTHRKIEYNMIGMSAGFLVMLVLDFRV